MFKIAKRHRADDAKPAIWAEGKQFAPLDFHHALRVTAILARRSAAKAWDRGSDITAAAAMAIEDGYGAGTVQMMGRAARLLPSRAFISQALARLSRLEAAAAQAVDHAFESIDPLEFSDLSGFMAHRREEARKVASETARKSNLSKAARMRAETAAKRKPAHDSDLSQSLSSSELPDEALDSEEIIKIVVNDPELLAIRSALASILQNPDPLPTQEQFLPPAPMDQTLSPVPMDRVAEPLVVPEPDTDRSGTIRRGSVWKRAGVLLARGVYWFAHLVWRLFGPALTHLTASILGWVLVGALLPFSLYRAIATHLGGQDLRYFD